MEGAAINKQKISNRAVLLLWLLALIQFWIISMFSAMPADMSTAESRPIAEKSVKVIQGAVDLLTGADGSDVYTQGIRISLKKVHVLVRKLAHLTNFMLLGFLYTMLAYAISEERPITAAATAVLSGLGASVSDELHQLFVPGRSAQISDVAIDFTGVVLGCVIFTVLLFCTVRQKEG